MYETFGVLPLWLIDLVLYLVLNGHLGVNIYVFEIGFRSCRWLLNICDSASYRLSPDYRREHLRWWPWSPLPYGTGAFLQHHGQGRVWGGIRALRRLPTSVWSWRGAGMCAESWASDIVAGCSFRPVLSPGTLTSTCLQLSAWGEEESLCVQVSVSRDCFQNLTSWAIIFCFVNASSITPTADIKKSNILPTCVYVCSMNL